MYSLLRIVDWGVNRNTNISIVTIVKGCSKTVFTLTYQFEPHGHSNYFTYTSMLMDYVGKPPVHRL